MLKSKDRLLVRWLHSPVTAETAESWLTCFWLISPGFQSPRWKMSLSAGPQVAKGKVEMPQGQ